MLESRLWICTSKPDSPQAESGAVGAPLNVAVYEWPSAPVVVTGWTGEHQPGSEFEIAAAAVWEAAAVWSLATPGTWTVESVSAEEPPSAVQEPTETSAMPTAAHTSTTHSLRTRAAYGDEVELRQRDRNSVRHKGFEGVKGGDSSWTQKERRQARRSFR